MVSESAASEIGHTTDALDRLSATEIFRLITRLPEGYRTVFNLFSIEGWTHKEIGEQLGISENTSRSQLSKARTFLQKMILLNETDNVRQQHK